MPFFEQVGDKAKGGKKSTKKTPRRELGDHEYKPTTQDGTKTDKARFARMQANLWKKEAQRREDANKDKGE